MPFVSTGDGATIHYRDTGGDGPAVVLVHDILMDGTLWDPQIASLAAEYRVITVDTRGHGETADAGGDYDYARLGDDIWAVVDELGMGEVVLGGLFHGGIVALWAACAAPERVRGLILIGTRADAYNPAEYAGYKMILLKQWALGDMPLEPITELIAAQMIGGEQSHRDYWTAKWNSGDRRRLAAPVTALLERPDIEDRIHVVTAPALLLYGSGDVVYTENRIRRLAERLGGPVIIETIDADGVNHAPTWTHPHLTDPVIRTFLDGLG
ncbi:alpha/beta fold hydrolase [Nocardia sp. NPDC055321]